MVMVNLDTLVQVTRLVASFTQNNFFDPTEKYPTSFKAKEWWLADRHERNKVLLQILTLRSQYPNNLPLILCFHLVYCFFFSSWATCFLKVCRDLAWVTSISQFFSVSSQISCDPSRAPSFFCDSMFLPGTLEFGRLYFRKTARWNSTLYIQEKVVLIYWD